jgi:hypothetical protein
MAGEQANQAAWSSLVSGLVFDTDNAIPQFWLTLRDQGQYIGLPVCDELHEADGTTSMAFSSGAVVVWVPNEGCKLL